MSQDANYAVPGALSTVARFVRRYPELSQGHEEIDIQEALIEATADIESMTSRRLAPFTNIIEETMLNGINPDEHQGKFPSNSLNQNNSQLHQSPHHTV